MRTLILAVVCLGSAPACSETSNNCTFTPNTPETEIATAFATAQDGAALVFCAGTFKQFKNTLTVAANNVTIKGAGMDTTILDFSGQQAGSEGLFAQNVSNITFSDMTVQNTKGNAIKVLSGTGVTMRKVKTTWLDDDSSTHGGYGLYPVQSKNVLIEDCNASQASDSGIYLGQSENAVLRRNTVTFNVAGIESENSYSVDVYENDVHDNTGGILVFDLPDLPKKNGHAVRVFKNQVHDNNTDNFAHAGNTVALIPRGTGILVMANTDVEIFQNDVKNNSTGNMAVISYMVTELQIKDALYYPFPMSVGFHDNICGLGGNEPDVKKKMGLLLSTAMAKFGGSVPCLIYDGITDPAKTTPPENPMKICAKQNQGFSFANLHLDKFDSANPNLDQILTLDATPYDCAIAALPPVAFPGL